MLGGVSVSKMSGIDCRRFLPSPHPLPLLLILPLFRSFPPVRERLEKERKRLLYAGYAAPQAVPLSITLSINTSFRKSTFTVLNPEILAKK